MTKIQASSENFCTSTINKKIIHVPTALAALGLKLNGIHLKLHDQRSKGLQQIVFIACEVKPPHNFEKIPNEFRNTNLSPKKIGRSNFCEWFPLLRFLITFFYAGLLGFACSVSASKIFSQMVILQNRGGKC